MIIFMCWCIMELGALKRGLCLVLMALVLFLNINLSLALDTSSKSDKKGGFQVMDESLPIIINSDHLEGDNKKGIIRFSGNVVAKRGDITIRSESTTIVYNEANKRIKEIIAEGGVSISQGNRVATGEKAIFIYSEEKIILTGNPIVREGNNVIKGGKIVLFLAEDRGVVEADENTRVNAAIHLGNKAMGEQKE